jgi:hypothetical protein
MRNFLNYIKEIGHCQEHFSLISARHQKKSITGRKSPHQFMHFWPFLGLSAGELDMLLYNSQTKEA